jgi:hypothetical protein
MSAENSITPGGRDVEQEVAPTGFQMPPELASRYELRVIDGVDGEQRLGLFRPTDRENPSIEITNDRIVARREDPETVAALVTIAQQSGWDRIAVDGSPEFRKAVWEAASREGLIVSGYEPTFAEQERVAGARKSADEQRRREIQEPAPPVEKVEAASIDAGSSGAPSPGQADQGPALDDDGQGLSAGDRRLLLTLSRHTEDRKGLYERFGWDMDEFAREVHFERLDLNQEALTTALDRALGSPTLVEAFERSGYEPDGLRRSGSAKEWDGEVANAIYLVRSGLHRDTLERNGEAQTLTERVPLDREAPAKAGRETRVQDQPEEHQPNGEAPTARAAADRGLESEELAELFLRGNPEHIAAEPRLAQARQAQAIMEQHIGEVFGDDITERASATLESRQMISDALRRGLDVAVREPTPVRQLEPAHARPDLER